MTAFAAVGLALVVVVLLSRRHRRRLRRLEANVSPAWLADLRRTRQ
jgi:hypothetical protein